MQASLLLPYCLHILHQNNPASPQTVKRRKKALSLILEQWGNCPVQEIVPARCGPTFVNMAKTTAEDCIALLRLLWRSFLCNVVIDHEVWERYSMPGRKSKYNVKARIEKNLLPPVFDEYQIHQVIVRCNQNITDKKCGGRYFMTAIMLGTGISITEACAVTRKKIYNLAEYPERAAISVDQEVTMEGVSRKRNDGTVRKNRHKIAKLSSTYQKRTLAFGEWLTTLWYCYLESHSKDSDAENSDSLIMSNNKNSKRVLTPDAFSDWLQETFGDILYTEDVWGIGAVTSSHRVEDYLVATAIDNLQKTGYLEEELQYQKGRAPISTDGKYYIAFEAESELVSMANYQDLWLRNVYHDLCNDLYCKLSRKYSKKQIPLRSRKYFAVEGKEMHHTRMDITIRIPPNSTFDDIQILCEAQHGFSGFLKSYMYVEEDGET